MINVLAWHQGSADHSRYFRPRCISWMSMYNKMCLGCGAWEPTTALQHNQYNDTIDGFQLYPTFRGQMCDQKTVIQRTIHLERSSFFFILQHWLNVVLPCLHYSTQPHRTQTLTLYLPEVKPHTMKTSTNHPFYSWFFFRINWLKQNVQGAKKKFKVLSSDVEIPSLFGTMLWTVVGVPSSWSCCFQFQTHASPFQSLPSE